jgi:hypothetical protein
MSGILDTPGGRWYWRRNRESFLPGFVEEAERAFDMDE